MERIVSYEDLPIAQGQSVYLRMEETDPGLYISLMAKGYKIINNIQQASESTIFITGRRQDYYCRNFDEYKAVVDASIQAFLKKKGITKPQTTPFVYEDLVANRYALPFVLKNENVNGGKEKFLIATPQDYENLIKACKVLFNQKLLAIASLGLDSKRHCQDYKEYLEHNFVIQEYIPTPSKYNTTVRLLTSSSNDLLYAALKYKKPDTVTDKTSLLGSLLSDVYPLSAKSIVSNTLSGGENILIGENHYSSFEKGLLAKHSIGSKAFDDLVESSQTIHGMCHSELGLLCGFDYIYDINKEQWYLLEYHSKPMVGDYSKRQGFSYQTKEERLNADGHVRATALALTLKKH